MKGYKQKRDTVISGCYKDPSGDSYEGRLQNARL